jgi:cell division protein FtsN
MRILGEPEKYGQDDSLQEGRRSGWRMLSIGVLIILALCGYLYFFTDLIRSHGEPRQDAELLVRKPLPRKGGALGTMSSSVKAHATVGGPSKQAEKPADLAKKSGPSPTKPATAEKSVQKPVTPPAEKPAAKNVPPAPPQQTVTAKRPGGETVTKKPATPAPEKSALPPTASPHLQMATPSATTAKPASPPAPATTKKSGNYFVIQCGPFASTSELAPMRTAMKTAGLAPAITPGPKQPTTMYRLFVAGYSDATRVVAERNIVLKATPNAFVLPHDGNHELFAGSYHEKGRATKEQERLAGRGIKTEILQTTIPVATKQLTAGSFPTREAADTVAERLKKDVGNCIVTERGR